MNKKYIIIAQDKSNPNYEDFTTTNSLIIAIFYLIVWLRKHDKVEFTNSIKGDN